MLAQSPMSFVHDDALNQMTRYDRFFKIIMKHLRSGKYYPLLEPGCSTILLSYRTYKPNDTFLLHLITHMLQSINLLLNRYKTCQFYHVNAWNPHYFIACVDLLGDQRFRWCQKYDLSIRIPSPEIVHHNSGNKGLSQTCHKIEDKSIFHIRLVIY